MPVVPKRTAARRTSGRASTIEELFNNLRRASSEAERVDLRHGHDDDDWVGTPPEGRHSRDRANPGFWRNQPPAAAAGAVLFVLAVIVLLLALL